MSRKYSKSFSHAELSQPQIINIPKILKDFSPAELSSQPQIINIPKILKDFSPAELSQPQIINIPEIFKDFFAGRVVLAANHQYPENAQSLLRLQKCLNRKSSISRKYSKTFSPAELSQLQVIGFPKCSKTFSPAELSQLQIINIPKILKVFFACRVVLAANHQYPENAQSLLRLQKFRSRNSSISRKYSKSFRLQNCLSCKSSVFRNLQRLFRRQSCLSPMSSVYRKYSKTSSPAELSQQQIIGIPKMLKVFFACRIVLAANHQNPGKIQRLIGLLNCLGPMSSVYRTCSKIFSPEDMSQLEVIAFPNYSKTFSPAELSQPQIINIAKVLKVFLACRIVLPASH